MDRLIKEHFTGQLHKINTKDIRGKEILFWAILALNVLAFFLNIFSGDFFFLINMAAAIIMMMAINNYYKNER